MSLFYDAFLSFSSQIQGQETITRPKNEDELANSVLARLQPLFQWQEPRAADSANAMRGSATVITRGAVPPSRQGALQPPIPAQQRVRRARVRRPAAAGTGCARPAELLSFFFFFPNRSAYLNVYFITSLQHIIPTLPRAEFCHIFLILIFCNDSLKSLSL